MLQAHHPVRIFAVSGILTLLSLIAVFYYLGPQAAFVTLVLIIVEVTFSFDNAIVNARVLMTMSRFWQQMFLTIGVLIAVFGMRLVFPILVVMLTAGLPWDEVVNLALNDPERYAAELGDAHVSIAAFGGMFLLMLCLHFFFDASRKVRWIDIIEKPLQRIGRWWAYGFTSFAVLVILSVLPMNDHKLETFVAGLCGIVTYLFVHGLAELFSRKEDDTSTAKVAARTGLAGFTAFLYLEVLDASFSLDSVIGAFAVTKDVVLIAIGLGVGAIWVRSLTIFMVRRHVLGAYRYIEHGAHYTIGMLAAVLLLGIFWHVSEFVAGILGVIIIAAAISSSVLKQRQEQSRGSRR
ncbi:TPA: hypothetical protein DCF80_01610 [Candidatus Saccharibacteria bacterium]|nr:hypothetical protein [Candidatus Saccharibacteria bacterium]